MNTAELIAKVAKTNKKVSQNQVRAIIGTTLTTIQAEVKKGGDVRLAGFGTFKKATRKARKGRNPKTGEAIKIKSSKFPRFKAGAPFKKLLN